MTDLRAQLQSTFGDAYTIERELGGGGMSRVFVATEQSLGRPVVVKVLPSETAGAVSVERFRREIRLAASLQQANIVPVLSAGDAGGVPYYTMPFVKGESLRSRIAAQGALPIDECVAILRDVARALAFAHAEGVVHRDIKPENILLSGGTAVVTDFGIARAVVASSTQPSAPTLTQIGVALGTPAYMAPEQAVGEQVDHRADIYALGVVAYEMLAGATPFSGRSAQATLAAHLVEAPVPVTQRRADVLPRLAELVSRCLAKEQNERPQSAAQVLHDLETVTAPSALPTRETAETSLAAKPSIAVLPLKNMSGTPDDEYFSDGITEDIIAQLGRIAELQVIARTSVMRYKSTEKRAREIGTDLAVSHLVEGSVRRAGQKLRIVAQLIDTSTEQAIWTETFDRELADVFAIQSEVAERVVAALTSRLTARDAKQGRQGTHFDAYDAYLRGRFEWNKGTREGFRRSIEHFERAISLDRDFGSAHAGLAGVLCISAVFISDAAGAFERARRHVMEALRVDPKLPEAHALLGYIQFWNDWNWPEAERVLRRAVQLGPNSAIAHNYLAVFLANLGRYDEGVEVARRSVELDPFWPTAHHDAWFTLFQSGRLKESVDAADRVLELAPDYAPALCGKAFSLIELGEYDQALAFVARSLATSPTVSLARTALVVAKARRGDLAGARTALAEMKRLDASSLQPSALAWAHAALGDIDAAFDAIERMITDREAFAVSFPTFRWWDPLRGDRRFDDVLLRLRFPAWSRAVADVRRLAYAERQMTAKVPTARPTIATPTAAPRPRQSIAVLPFVNVSADAENEYFSDGITEDVIARLSKVDSLKVISRTSVMRFKGTTKAIREIAGTLGVATVLEGSVRRAGPRLRVTAQLIDAESDEHLWSETYDRRLADVFDVQAEVAEAIAAALHAWFPSTQGIRKRKGPAMEVETYNLCLLGRHHWHRWTEPDFRKSIEYYERAIAREPDCALAHAGLGIAYGTLALGYWSVRGTDLFPLAKRSLTHAIDLDPELVDAHGWLGVFEAQHEFTWGAAEARVRRAVALDDNSATAHDNYHLLLLATGRLDEASRESARSVELDPLSYFLMANTALCAYRTRQYDLAIELFHKEITLDPNLPMGYALLGLPLIQAGRGEEAVSALERALQLGYSIAEPFMAMALVAVNRRDDARVLLQTIEARRQKEHAWPFALAMAYSALGDADKAFANLRTAFDERDFWMVWLRVEPALDPLRGDPRFRALLEQTNLADAEVDRKSLSTYRS